MSTSLYDLTVPVFVRGFASLSNILEKGRAFADEQGIDHAELLNARLIDDMAPLTAQIQRASDTSKGSIVRLGGILNVPMADNEASFDELQARIAATVAFLKDVPRDAIDGREDATVILETPNRKVEFVGRGYVLDFVIPNFFFHVTTAYALLRQRGVPIGKLDYLSR